MVKLPDTGYRRFYMQKLPPTLDRSEYRERPNEINYGDLFGMTKQQAVALHPLYKIDPDFVQDRIIDLPWSDAH